MRFSGSVESRDMVVRRLSAWLACPAVVVVVGLGLAMASQGCAANNTGRLDVTVEIDPLLALDSVQFEASAPSRPTPFSKELPASGVTSLQWTVIVRDPGTLLDVTLSARGKRGGQTVVTYGALARVSTGDIVSAVLHLGARCLSVPACPTNQTCEEGSCVDRPIFDAGKRPLDAARPVDAALDAGAAQPDRPGSADAAPDRPAAVDSGCGSGGCVPDGAAPGCVGGATRLCKDDPDLNALGNCGGGVELCTAGHWGSCSIAPAAKDSCALIGDDASCNGKPNEGCPCVDGTQQPCGPAVDLGICKRGTQTCVGATWGACTGAVFAASRDCTSANDNNCDGTPDNAPDGVCVCAAATTRPCDEHIGKDGKGRCKAGVQSCIIATDRKTSAWGTCTGSVAPAAADACSPGNDDNCNGLANEGCTCVEATKQACGPAAEVGICKKGSQTCAGGVWGACAGAVFAAARDCTSALDNDCDGVADNTIDAVCGCASGGTRACGQHAGKDGNGPCKAGSQSCVVAADKKSSVWAACLGAVGPAPADGCDVTNDDNCNGTPHEGCTCVNGATRGCGPAAIGICKPGIQTCTNASFGTACPGAVTALARDCTSTKDNDCNGVPDNQDSTCVCVAGTTGACPGNNNTPCKSGTRTCALAADKGSTSWGTTCVGQVLPAAADTCVRNNDANCNLAPNEGCECINDDPPKPCACGTQSCTNGRLNSCVVSCPGLCIGGACCAAPKAAACGGTVCCTPPSASLNASIACASGPACALQCNPGNHACTGTATPCYANDNSTKCGATCTNCAKVNQNPVCDPVAGRCANTCVVAGTKLSDTCNGGGTSCGNWAFETGPEDWALHNVFDEPHASTGPLTTAPGVIPSSGRSLSIPYTGTSLTAPVGATLRLIVPLCTGGVEVPLAGKTFKADLRFVSSSPHAFLQVNGSVQTGGDPKAGVGAFSFCDFFLDDGAPAAGGVQPISCAKLVSSSYLIIYFGVSSDSTWVGTVYLDNVTIM